MTEHRAGARECVKFAVFAAGINVIRKGCDETRIKASAGEEWAEFGWINAREICAKPSGEHFLSKDVGVAAPNRENGRHAAGCELLFAIGADVFEEKVAEDDVINALVARTSHRFAHGLFVGFVWARRWDWDFDERQAGGFSLEFEQRLADGVHGDAFMRAVDCGEQRGDFELPRLARQVERPGTVFAAAPCEPGFGTRI